MAIITISRESYSFGKIVAEKIDAYQAANPVSS